MSGAARYDIESTQDGHTEDLSRRDFSNTVGQFPFLAHEPLLPVQRTTKQKPGVVHHEPSRETLLNRGMQCLACLAPPAITSED